MVATPPPVGRTFKAVFSHRATFNRIQARELILNAESVGKAIALARNIASDSKGYWMLEHVKES